jgi:hypothetical protein
LVFSSVTASMSYVFPPIFTALLLAASTTLPLVALAPAAARAQTAEEACATYRPGMPARERMADGNARRLHAAEVLLAPGFAAGAAATSRSLLAEYQEEMERVRPNPATAALYLATVSTVPISPAVVSAVNTVLCVASSPAIAQAVATQAEAARREMSR